MSKTITKIVLVLTIIAGILVLKLLGQSPTYMSLFIGIVIGILLGKIYFQK